MLKFNGLSNKPKILEAFYGQQCWSHLSSPRYFIHYQSPCSSARSDLTLSVVLVLAPMAEVAGSSSFKGPATSSIGSTEATLGREGPPANAPPSGSLPESSLPYEDESTALDVHGQELKRTAERNPNNFFAQTAYARYQADIGGDARIAVRSSTNT